MVACKKNTIFNNLPRLGLVKGPGPFLREHHAMVFIALQKRESLFVEFIRAFFSCDVYIRSKKGTFLNICYLLLLQPCVDRQDRGRVLQRHGPIFTGNADILYVRLQPAYQGTKLRIFHSACKPKKGLIFLREIRGVSKPLEKETF